MTAECLITPVQAAPESDTMFAAFLYGYGGPAEGEDWGVDLGRPVRYSKWGGVHRQDFERGVALANTGDTFVRVELGGFYRDAAGALRSVLGLRAHSAAVLSQDGFTQDRPSPR